MTTTNKEIDPFTQHIIDYLKQKTKKIANWKQRNQSKKDDIDYILKDLDESAANQQITSFKTKFYIFLCAKKL